MRLSQKLMLQRTRSKPGFPRSLHESNSEKMATSRQSIPREDLERLVIKYAVSSRLLVLALIFLWRSLVDPYDTSAPIDTECLRPVNENQFPPPMFPYIGSVIQNSVVWDSVYFVRIAQCGYEYEQTYAFLPLLPFCISTLSRTALRLLVPLIGYRAVLALSGYIVSNVAFVITAMYLYRLSVIILKDPEAALRASALFCFNPASIFYSSIYSESLYALFSIGGMYYFIAGSINMATLWFALSGCARSNGFVNAGYICFQTMHGAYTAISLHKRILVVISGALRCKLVFAPFVAFQAYAYYNICHGRPPDGLRPWCTAKIPFLYNFIQSHYWKVGFLRYFQLKQLPNFLLASPILSLAACSIVSYVKSRPEVSLSLGFGATNEEKRTYVYSSVEAIPKQNAINTAETPPSKMENHNRRRRKQISRRGDPIEIDVGDRSRTRAGYFSASVLPFVAHLAFMAATAFFVMHVQVATRFLSASPSLYWFASYLMTSPGRGRTWGFMIWVYSMAYILLGSILFSNFYPFT